jgi:iron complex transport system ATP-binding protein
MRDGEILARGPPAEVLTADLVEAVFAMPGRVIDDPETGTPMVVPGGRRRRRALSSPPADDHRRRLRGSRLDS